MTDDHPLDDAHSDVERRIDAALRPGDGGGASLARSVATAYDDRWYGQLVLRSNQSVRDGLDVETIVPAATAVELLRGYCRVRNEQLLRRADDTTRPSREPSAALLAGDLLYSTAYSELAAVDAAPIDACFETLTTVTGTIVAALSRRVQAGTATAADPSVIDGTAGALGRGAAVIGATLAGVDDSDCDRFATLGRGLGVGRRVSRTLDPDDERFHSQSTGPDAGRLRRHAEQRLDDATAAVEALSSVADVATLRSLVDDVDSSGR